ncbi:MAG: hypothetical protein SWO11_17230 [Thermodesulfobacteriota bacterium]|nr:hypothetical protein [Thermodesulfobacteriota bacterium]
MNWKCGVPIAVFLLFFVIRASASEIIWLSDAPPEKVSKEIRHGMRGVSLINGKDGRERKILWIRSGSFPVESRYVNRTNTKKPVVFVISPNGERIKGELSHSRWGYVLTFEGNMEGFYNVYLFEMFVEGDTLNIMVAKAEVLSHKCSNGHAQIRRKMSPRILQDDIPFEIVRERIPGEDFHTFLSSGDDLILKVIFNGAPLEAANITLRTQKRWIKGLKTNMYGKAAFQLIGDYYPRWKEINKRNNHNFLLTAEHTIKECGSYEGIPYRLIHYIGTLGDVYIPSKTMYSSSLYGLVVLLFVITITGIFIYFHRERRKRPYREYVFGEKD